MLTRIVVACCLLVGFPARADTKKPPSVVARVVGLDVYTDTTIVTLAVGSEQGVGKTWHARFRDGKTQKLLAGGEATVIRIDHRTMVVKTSLSPAQVRANRYVQLDP
jgi:hypothetical protein